MVQIEFGKKILFSFSPMIRTVKRGDLKVRQWVQLIRTNLKQLYFDKI